MLHNIVNSVLIEWCHIDGTLCLQIYHVHVGKVLTLSRNYTVESQAYAILLYQPHCLTVKLTVLTSLL